jgi:alanyl-tRNA synthetase
VTERLYYTDARVTEFDAIVVAAGESGGRPWAVLDRTAFYPTSGGQPHDLGELGGAAVVDVVDREDGTIAHVVDRALAEGAAVHGRIDWARRFDHMQQHTGQHVLSAAFDRLCQARTVSFHLGVESCTIDLDRVIAPERVAAAEEEANRIVWEDRPVTVRFATAAEAAALPLRKEPQRDGLLRLVDVADFDLSACGGTHVSRTGAIGLVAVSSWEKFRGGLRVEFLCGARALGRFRALRDAVAGSIRALSVAPAELPDAIARAQADNKALRRVLRGLTEQLAVHEADRLVAAGTAVGGVTLVAEALDAWDAAGLKALATAVAARPGCLAVCLSAAPPLVVAIARSADTPIDASAVLKALIAEFGGKGGGKPELAQGGGLAAEPARVIAAVARQLA